MATIIDAISLDPIGRFDVDITVSPARLRFRLQPYFFASPFGPPQGPCDSCARRRPDFSMHWAVASVELLSVDSEAPPDVSGCACNAAGCYVRHCDAQQVAGQPVDDLADVPTILDAQIATALATNALGNLDESLYQVLADPLIGGALFWRPEAVDALRDAPVCDPAPTPPVVGTISPAVVNPNCPATGGFGDPSPRTTRIADTVEALRVVDGRAEVLAREN